MNRWFMLGIELHRLSNNNLIWHAYVLIVYNIATSDEAGTLAQYSNSGYVV